MNKQKLYITTLSAAFFASIIIPQFILSNPTIDFYIDILALCYFGVTGVFRPRRRAPDLVGGALFVTFCYFILTRTLGLHL